MRGCGLAVVRGLLASVVGCAACAGSGDDTWLQSTGDIWLPAAAAQAGRVQFGLSKQQRIEVDAVAIALTAPGGETSTYEIDTTSASAASISLGGLSAGSYAVIFSATTRSGAPCVGSAEFEVEPGVDTRVHVEIVCDIE